MSYYSNNIKKSELEKLERSLVEKKRKQLGITFPSATKQKHLLIIRFNISHLVSGPKEKAHVRSGISRLCNFLEKIDKGKLKVDDLSEDGNVRTVPLSEFNFSATLGFGIGFFEKLKIPQEHRPKKLREMPNHFELGDQRPYSLLQTDFIIQLGSSDEEVNRWVYRNITAKRDLPNVANRQATLSLPESDKTSDNDGEIYSIIKNWATVTDIHSGFQRTDGRNLLGFNDGISNPKRLSNDIVWITPEDESVRFSDGTYMVFQKIEHNLEVWCSMTIEKQEKWVGRSKDTGLLLGTLTKEQDARLALDLHSEDTVTRDQAKQRWKKLYNEQKDPDKRFFDTNKSQYKEIQLECPVWSHVRKSNPRQADGAARSLIFRRGYLFVEGGSNGIFDSGLLFICFQRDIEKGFEYIKKNFLMNKNFPVPDQRKNFNTQELEWRHRHARFTDAELKRGALGPFSTHYASVADISYGLDSQNTGREGLSGPSELGVYPEGEQPVTSTLGGGYYFIPPIPKKQISNIGEQFFL